MPAQLTEKRETIAVVGSGLAGAMSAIFLAKAGYNVTLIEREPRGLMVSSKIPVHLHSGGLYSGTAAIHCLHDSINFRKVLPFAVTDRPTAFAVMTLDDTVIRASGMTQLVEEAEKIFKSKKENEGKSFADLSPEQKNQYKDMAKQQQLAKWEKMKAHFAYLKSQYTDMVTADPTNEVFGPPETYFKAYEQEEFAALSATAQKVQADPAPQDKDGWTAQLARVTDPSQVLGVVMSSEVGLNMMRAGAGIELELERLQATGTLTVLTNVNVSQVSRNGNFMHLTLASTQSDAGAVSLGNLTVNQVVNATGYRGKEIDMSMGVQTDWAVDVKGAGVVELDEEFSHVPEVFFTEGVGMSHLSRFNETMAGINYCDPTVEATYISGGRIEFQPGDSLDSKSRLAELERDILQLPPTHSTLVRRTQQDIDSSTRFMPTLTQHATPVAYVGGALGLIGGLANRDSLAVYHSVDGYHAINLAKGGGAVSTAMTLVEHVERRSVALELMPEEEAHFPHGSHSALPKEFKLDDIDRDGLGITAQAKARAEAMGVSAELAMPYRPN